MVKIQIHIDYRERGLIQLFAAKSVITAAEIEILPPVNLVIGDIQLLAIGDLGQTLGQMYIERKSYSDLIASIKDGRYREQKMRLKAGCAANLWPSRYLYMVESGELPPNLGGESAIFYGSWISMCLRDNIPVIRVLDMNESYLFLMRLAERMVRDFADLLPSVVVNISGPPVSSAGDGTRQIILNSNGGKSAVDYLEASVAGIKTKKGENMTRELCHNHMLVAVPGISSGLSEQILSKFDGSICKLIASLALINGETADTRRKYLSELELKTSTGKTRKLGPAIAAKLWDFLGETNQSTSPSTSPTLGATTT